MRSVLVIFVSLLLSKGSIGQTSDSLPKQNAAAVEAIHQVLADFINAWNSHDANAFSVVFAEDADFTNIRGNGAHGRTNIDSFHAAVFRTLFKDSHQKISNSKIRFIRADIAAVDAWWEMTGSTNPAGQSIPLRKGLLNFIMAKNGGKWVIEVMHNMELAVAP